MALSALANRSTARYFTLLKGCAEAVLPSSCDSSPCGNIKLHLLVFIYLQHSHTFMSSHKNSAGLFASYRLPVGTYLHLWCLGSCCELSHHVPATFKSLWNNFHHIQECYYQNLLFPPSCFIFFFSLQSICKHLQHHNTRKNTALNFDRKIPYSEEIQKKSLLQGFINLQVLVACKNSPWPTFSQKWKCVLFNLCETKHLCIS